MTPSERQTKHFGHLEAISPSISTHSYNAKICEIVPAHLLDNFWIEFTKVLKEHYGSDYRHGDLPHINDETSLTSLLFFMSRELVAYEHALGFKPKIKMQDVTKVNFGEVIKALKAGKEAALCSWVKDSESTDSGPVCILIFDPEIKHVSPYLAIRLKQGTIKPWVMTEHLLFSEEWVILPD